MKKLTLFSVALFFALIFSLPTGTVKAIVTPPFDVRICGTQFYINSLDYPTYVIGIVDEYGPGGTPHTATDFFAYGFPNDVWTDVGYPIESLTVTWGTFSGPMGSFSVTGNSCAPKSALIDMYVYYSATPFFGNTHTLTIFSAAGFPSKGTVTAFAGGKLPDGFAYGAPACWAPLYDDGSDKGVFACDSFLASVGERRAWLRNDPEGPAFDLLPKIQNYYRMLDELGITPRAP